MIRQISFFCLLILGMVTRVWAQDNSQTTAFQRSLSLRPMVQIAWSTSSYNSNEKAPDFFKLTPSSPNQLGVAGSLGLLVDYQYSPKLQFTTGLYKAPVGYGFIIDAPADALTLGKPLSSDYQDHQLAWHFPVHINYDLAKVQLFGNQAKNNYFLRFKLKGIAGLSLSYSKKQPNGYGLISTVGDGSLFTNPPPTNTEKINYIVTNSSNTSTNRTNASLLLGFGLQFFNKLGKDGFRLDFLYNYGFRTQMTMDIDYNVNNVYIGTAPIKSKGTWFGMRLSHPIRVKTWK